MSDRRSGRGPYPGPERRWHERRQAWQLRATIEQLLADGKLELSQEDGERGFRPPRPVTQV